MPSAMLKACPEAGCPELAESGRCSKHARQVEQRRGSSHERGYTRPWSAFRADFRQFLISAGIAPVCGAALPGGPDTSDAQCVASGFLNDQQLELDHDPPLTPAERSAWSTWQTGARGKTVRCALPRCTDTTPHPAFTCRYRVAFRCRADHARKTQREQQEGRV